MPTAGRPPSDTPPERGRREAGLWVEDALILAAVAALGVCAFRGPLGLESWQTASIMGVTLAVMTVVAVLRVRRLVRMRRARSEGARGAGKDGGHAH